MKPKGNTRMKYNKTNYINTLTSIKNGTRTTVTSPMARIIQDVIDILENPEEYALHHRIRNAMRNVGVTEKNVNPDDVCEIANRLDPEAMTDRLHIQKITQQYISEIQKIRNRFPIARMLIESYPDIPLQARICPSVRAKIKNSIKSPEDDAYIYTPECAMEWGDAIPKIHADMNAHLSKMNGIELESVTIVRLTETNNMDGILQIVDFEDPDTEHSNIWYRMPREYISFGNSLTKQLLKRIAYKYAKSHPKYDSQPFTWNDFHEIPYETLHGYDIERIDEPEKNGLMTGRIQPNPENIRTLFVYPDENLLD